MDFTAYLGIGFVVLGLAMAAREVARREHAEALNSIAGVSLLGALLLTFSLMERGWLSRAVMVGFFVLALALRWAASRLSRQQRG